MSFEFTRRPQPGAVVDTINLREDGIDAVSLPSASLILGERRFWRELKAQTDPETQLGSIAVRLAYHMEELRVGYAMANLAISRGLLVGEGALMFTDWYSDAAVSLPYSRFLRKPQIFQHLEQATPPDDDHDHVMFMDYMPNERNKTGLHLPVRDVADYGLPAIESGSERWLEDEDLFLRARSPAEPTAELTRVYKQEFGKRFDRAAFISFSPRMKPEAWAAD
ncbi:MAG TPA: hypothetical protein VJM32_02190 [Candidatus Saccharimonadales bacterium]|nr:hypothetical protein [Candidatus Saccharimonadales bacterium]